MSKRFIAAAAVAGLFLMAEPVYAQRGGGGHGGGGHAGGGGGGRAGGGYRGGYSGGYRGGEHGGYRGGYGLGYGGYGLGYGGYGLGYGGYGAGYGNYGYAYPSYGYASPSYGYSYPSTYEGYYPTAPTVVGSSPLTGTVLPASGSENSFTPSLSATPAVAAPATVTVFVPEGAQVWLDGKETTGTGTSRVFTSPKLEPGQSSVLAVKARWGGSTYSAQVPIQAGDKFSVDLR
jgi:uncharacterized protein (TIGR03000 family)